MSSFFLFIGVSQGGAGESPRAASRLTEVGTDGGRKRTMCSNIAMI